MYVDILLSTLIKQVLKHGKEFTGQWPPHTWLREHRTITLGLPRRCGKTTALVNLYRSRPSLLFTPRAQMRDAIRISHGVECLTLAEYLRQARTMVCQHPVELILLDECLDWENGQRDQFYQFATDLLIRSQLSGNIVIVNVGT